MSETNADQAPLPRADGCDYRIEVLGYAVTVLERGRGSQKDIAGHLRRVADLLDSDRNRH